MSENTEVAQNGTAPERKPSEQALQVVDRAVGAVPVAVDAVRHAVGQFGKPAEREQEEKTLQERVTDLRDAGEKELKKDLKALEDKVSKLRDADARPDEVETFKQRLTAELENAGERGADVRRQVTDQVVEQARKARDRVEPVYRDRVEPVYKQRVEPVYKERVEPVYRDRVEPTVRRVRERI